MSQVPAIQLNVVPTAAGPERPRDHLAFELSYSNGLMPPAHDCAFQADSAFVPNQYGSNVRIMAESSDEDDPFEDMPFASEVERLEAQYGSEVAIALLQARAARAQKSKSRPKQAPARTKSISSISSAAPAGTQQAPHRTAPTAPAGPNKSSKVIWSLEVEAARYRSDRKRKTAVSYALSRKHPPLDDLDLGGPIIFSSGKNVPPDAPPALELGVPKSKYGILTVAPKIPTAPTYPNTYEGNRNLSIYTASDIVQVFVAGQTEQTYDARKFPLCCPHDGTKGPRFRRFCDDFLTAIALVPNRDLNDLYDLAETLCGLDEGGANIPAGHAAPIPLPGGAAALRRRTTRLKQSYSYLYKYVDCVAIQLRFSNECFNDGAAAWRLLRAECDEPITDLELEDLKRAVRELSIISSVGHNENSVSLFRRALNDANCKIPTPADRIPESELALILLRAIGRSSPHLAIISDTELKAAPANRLFVHPAGHPRQGERSLEAIISHFEPLWKSAMQRGSISVRAPSARGGHAPGLDGFSVDSALDGDDTGGDYAQDELDNGQVLAAVANAMMKSSAPSTPLTKEPVCWNCKGIGHLKGECPSPRRDRPYSAVVKLLTSIMGKPGKPPRAGGRPPPRRPGPSPRTASAADVAAYLMADGSFITADGDAMQWLDVPGPESLAPDDSAEAPLEEAELVQVCMACTIAEPDPPWALMGPAYSSDCIGDGPPHKIPGSTASASLKSSEAAARKRKAATAPAQHAVLNPRSFCLHISSPDKHSRIDQFLAALTASFSPMSGVSERASLFLAVRRLFRVTVNADLLRSSGAGLAIGRLARRHPDEQIRKCARLVLASWKQQIAAQAALPPPSLPTRAALADMVDAVRPARSTATVARSAPELHGLMAARGHRSSVPDRSARSAARPPRAIRASASIGERGTAGLASHHVHTAFPATVVTPQ